MTVPTPVDERRPLAMPRTPAVVWRAGFALSVLLFALTIAARRYVEVSFGAYPGGDPWMTGDWLINYGGGFVRRGLFGQLFLTSSPGGEAGQWMLFGFQIAIYALLAAYSIEVLHRTRYSWSSIALVCGPATLTFIGWVPSIDAAFRKELLIFAVLVLLAWSRRPERTRTGVILLVSTALLLFVVAVFSWEASALLLPAVMYLLIGGARDRDLLVFRRSAFMIFGVVGALGAGISTLLHGDVATADAVCDTARAYGFHGAYVCSAGVTSSGGAIEAIGWTSYKTREDLAIAAAVYVGYLPLITLSAVPVVLSRWFRRNWLWAALIAVAVAPLYFIVTDYGRWTHIASMALMLCITADDPHAAHSRFWNWLSSLLYVSLWGMPHWMGEAQLGESWWPRVGLLDRLSQTAIDQVGAQATRGTVPDLPGKTVMDITARYLAGSPSNGTDSWEPMALALDHVQRVGSGLYETLFFQGGVKFQYPPTSLLFLEPLRPFEAHPVAVMNVVGWLSVAMTALLFFKVTLLLVTDTWPSLAGARTTAAVLTATTVSTLTYSPLMQAWDLGQAQGLINMLSVGALYACLRGNRLVAGVALGLACLIKPQLALFLFWGLIRRDARFVVGMVGTGALGLMVSVIRYGWQNNLDYLRVLSFLSQHGEIYYGNQSFNGLAQRLVGNGDALAWQMRAFPDFHPTVYVVTMASTACLVAIGLLAAGGRGFWSRAFATSRPRLVDTALDFSLAQLCFTLASPIAWEHHFGVVLPAFAVVTVAALATGRRRLAAPVIALVVVAYLLTTNTWWVWALPLTRSHPIVASYFMFGMLALLLAGIAVRAAGLVALPGRRNVGADEQSAGDRLAART